MHDITVTHLFHINVLQRVNSTALGASSSQHIHFVYWTVSRSLGSFISAQ